MKKIFLFSFCFLFLAVNLFSQDSIIKTQTAEEYFKSGNNKSDAGDFKGAIKDYDNAILLNPNLIDGYNNRGVAKGNLGEYKRGNI